jgi:hypothetical protein
MLKKAIKIAQKSKLTETNADHETVNRHLRNSWSHSLIDWHKTVDFVKRDWHGHPVRLCLEVFNWFLNIIVVVTFAATVPDVPFLLFIPCSFAVWLLACTQH